MKDQRAWVMCLCAAIAGVVGACGVNPTEESVVRIGYQHPLVSIDPHGHRDAVTGAVLGAVYEPLIRIDERTSLVPCLAVSWESPNERTWRLKLRPGTLFHDGREMEAVDVIASINRARNHPASARRRQVNMVEEVYLVDGSEDVIEMRLKRPDPLLLIRLSYVAIVPRDFDPDMPTGTGPFRWMSQEPEGTIELRRWDRYWGDPPDMDVVRVCAAVGQTELKEMAREGVVDVILGVSVQNLSEERLADDWQVVEIPSTALTYLGMNINSEQLRNPEVRRAIDSAVHREALVLSTPMPEFADQPAYSLVPPEVFGFVPPERTRSAEVEYPREIMQKAKVTPGTRLVVEHSGQYQPAVSYLVSVLYSLGFAVETVEYSYEDYYRLLETGPENLFVFGWSFTTPDSLDFLQAFAHTRDQEHQLGRFNGARYSSNEVDAWLDAAGREMSSSTRLELLRRAVLQVTEDRPYLPLFRNRRFGMCRQPFEVVPRSGSWPMPQEVRIRTE